MGNDSIARTRLEEIYRYISEGVIYQEADGSIKLFNQAAQRIFGMSEDEAYGRTSTSHEWYLVHEDGSPCPGDEHPSMITLRTGRALVEQVRGIARPDRPVTWISISTRPILRPGRELPEAVVISFTDITERRRVEAEQEDSGRRQRIAMDLAKLVHWEYDVEEDLFTFDDRFYSLYGTSSSIEGGTRMSAKEYAERFLPPEEIPMVADEIKAAMETADPNYTRKIEHRIIRADGQERHMRICFGLVKDSAGRTVKTIGANQDITDRKRFEEELRNRNKFIEMILEYLPIGLGVNSIDSGEVTYLNKKFEEIYGWPREDFSNVSNFFEKVFPDPVDRETKKTKIVDDIASGDPDRMVWEDLEITTKEGRKRIVLAKNIPIPDQNIMISTVQDFTDRRRLEAQLRQAQKMEAVGTLAGGIAHDFNNILAAIMGNAEIAVDEAARGRSNLRELDSILESSERAKRLVQRILTFSRQSEPEFKPLDLNKEVVSATNLLQQTLPRMIEIQLNLSDGLDAILGDPYQIEQVLLNLATNARDAMPDGGTLAISTRRREVTGVMCVACTERIFGEFVILRVADTGEGMNREAVERMFDPFFTTKEVGKGTGLGLSTVLGTINSHNGHVACSSEPGQGTVFEFYFPPSAARVIDSADEMREETIGGGRETILLVDDEDHILKIESQHLSGRGYGIITAKNGEEALEICRARGTEIDLIVLDLSMPGMGGHRCLEEILALDPDRKVIISTGYSRDGDIRETMTAGIAALLYKPVLKADLLKTVRMVLDA